jgi:hypothetical protein
MDILKQKYKENFDNFTEDFMLKVTGHSRYRSALNSPGPRPTQKWLLNLSWGWPLDTFQELSYLSVSWLLTLVLNRAKCAQ